MTTRSAIQICLCLGALGTPLGVASANNVVSIRLSQSWLRGSGFDALSSSDLLLQAEINYARQIVDLWEGSLWVEGSWAVGRAESKVFGKIGNKTLLQNATAGARYMLPLWSWLVPFARVGLGVAVGSLELAPEGSPSASDRASAFCGHLLLGFEVLWPRSRARHADIPLTGGLVVEGGYGFSTSLRFDLAPHGDDKKSTIPMVSSSLGSVNLSGGQLRVGVVLHF